MSTGIVAIEPESSQAESEALAQYAPALVDHFGHQGAGTLTLTSTQADILIKPFPDEDHEILVTGEVYVSHIHVRRKLAEVFGPGGWALVPQGPYTLTGDRVSREYVLVGHGRFLASAIGGSDYQPTNERMAYDDACEAAKSNALTRCAKDLLIASECWDRRYTERFKAKYCVQAWRSKQKDNKPHWRRVDAGPFYDETGTLDQRPGPRSAPPPPEEAEYTQPTPPAPKPAPAPRPQPKAQATGRPGNVPCPKCGQQAMPSQWAKPGATFYCKGCGNKFDPSVTK